MLAHSGFQMESPSERETPGEIRSGKHSFSSSPSRQGHGPRTSCSHPRPRATPAESSRDARATHDQELQPCPGWAARYSPPVSAATGLAHPQGRRVGGEQLEPWPRVGSTRHPRHGQRNRGAEEGTDTSWTDTHCQLWKRQMVIAPKTRSLVLPALQMSSVKERDQPRERLKCLMGTLPNLARENICSLRWQDPVDQTRWTHPASHHLSRPFWGVPLGIHPSIHVLGIQLVQKRLEENMSRGSPKPPDGGRDDGKAVKLQPPINRGWWANEAEEKQVALLSTASFLQQHLNPGEGGVNTANLLKPAVFHFNTPLCLPPQNQGVGNKKKWCPPWSLLDKDTARRYMINNSPWRVWQPWRLGKWHLEGA